MVRSVAARAAQSPQASPGRSQRMPTTPPPLRPLPSASRDGRVDCGREQQRECRDGCNRARVRHRLLLIAHCRACVSPPWLEREWSNPTTAAGRPTTPHCSRWSQVTVDGCRWDCAAACAWRVGSVGVASSHRRRSRCTHRCRRRRAVQRVKRTWRRWSCGSSRLAARLPHLHLESATRPL